MKQKVFKRLKGESGLMPVPATIVIFSLLVLMFGVSLDLNHNVSQKAKRYGVAQQAAQAATTWIGSNGSLSSNRTLPSSTNINESVPPGTPRSVVAVIDNFVNVTKESNGDDTCSSAKIDGVERTLPYYEVYLGQGTREKGIPTTGPKWAFQGTKNNVKLLNTSYDYRNDNIKYTTITIVAHTSSRNSMLPMFGLECQYYKSVGSAISFGSNFDLN